jgi:hypothetical protein
MTMSEAKQIGCCSCCGEHLWDVADIPATRRGVRATAMLFDGSLMDLTLGDCCLKNPDLDRIWSRVVEGWFAEDAPKYALKQLQANGIAALLYTMKWKDVETSNA